MFYSLSWECSWVGTALASMYKIPSQIPRITFKMVCVGGSSVSHVCISNNQEVQAGGPFIFSCLGSFKALFPMQTHTQLYMCAYILLPACHTFSSGRYLKSIDSLTSCVFTGPNIALRCGGVLGNNGYLGVYISLWKSTFGFCERDRESEKRDRDTESDREKEREGDWVWPDFWNLQVHPLWHTSSNKVTPTSARPHLFQQGHPYSNKATLPTNPSQTEFH